MKATKKEEWKEKFRNHSLKIGFALSLTKPMLEYLCATADDVQWDRTLYFSSISHTCPNNFIASQAALEKRGLIRKKEPEEFARSYNDGHRCEWATCTLTPAGEALIELLKVVGLFIEADAAINKRTRKKA